MAILEEALTKFLSSGELVRVFREDLVYGRSLTGRILQYSTAVLLLETYDADLRPTGFTGLRCEDVTRIVSQTRGLVSASGTTKPSRQQFQAVATLQIESAVTEFQRAFGFITLYAESLDPDLRIIGTEVEVDDDHVRLNMVGDHDTTTQGSMLLRLCDVTRVDGGKREVNLGARV